MKVLLTGASGFVGKGLTECLNLTDNDVELTCGVRKERNLSRYKDVVVGELNGLTNWHEAVRCQDIVIHTAARAHVMNDNELEPLSEYRKVNVEGTLNLAKQSINAGVRRFIFISSVKVNGEVTRAGSPFTFNDTPAPEDAYGLSKLEAENALKILAAQTDMEVIIVRAPLVYGRGAKGNFKALMGLAKKNVPLPFGAVKNKRSLVSLENLVSLIITCVKHPQPLNETFLVSDDHDVSTRELFETLTRAYGKKPKLWPCPVGLMRFGATILGKKAIADRLFGNLQVDITHTKKTLNWEPPVSFQQAMQTCIKHELNSSNNP
ncbi:UDP-glucose 4-epimerase family protein [Idiomarina loihiensis]|uniref:UDP-glucose 4-epimerase family protein n=1 Tax=Idiomarina loihiensis TaxID=135577 RepID=UPI00384F794F